MAKRLKMAILLTLCLSLVLLLAQITPAQAEEAEEVYVIDSEEDFFAIMDNPQGHYRLETDLDLGLITALGVDPKDEYVVEFCGVLDGNGHTIRYRMTEMPGGEYYGLFARIDGAEIFNLYISADIQVTKSDAGDCNVGILAGQSMYSSVAGIHVSGNLTVYNSNPIVSDGYSITDVVYVGGLFGCTQETKMRSCSVDTQVDLNCTGGVPGNYGGFNGDGNSFSAAYSCTLSGCAKLRGNLDSVYLLSYAQNSVSTQNVNIFFAEKAYATLDEHGIDNELHGTIELEINVVQLSNDRGHPLGLTLMENSKGSTFTGTVSVRGSCDVRECSVVGARNCENISLIGDIQCRVASDIWCQGLVRCSDSVFEMDMSIESDSETYIYVMNDGSNNRGQSAINHVNQSAVESSQISVMEFENGSYFEGTITTQTQEGCSCHLINGSNNCKFIGTVYCESPNGTVRVGGCYGNENIVLADLSAVSPDYSTGIDVLSGADNYYKGKCYSSKYCQVVSGANNSANVEIKASIVSLMSGDNANCRITGTATADNIYLFEPGWLTTNSSNGYIKMDLVIRDQHIFNAAGNNCVFEGTVDMTTSRDRAEVISDVPVTVHLPDGTAWNTAKGSLYRHEPYSCEEGHPLYSEVLYPHFSVCIDARKADGSSLSDVTSQWPGYMQPDSGDEPEDDGIQIGLYETADCEESTKISSIMYSCGNFSWNRTVGTDETDQTNYGTCYLKIQRKGMHEDIILERAELEAPDGFSFSPREMVKTKTVNLASVISGEHVIAVYPIYTEKAPETEQDLVFKVNGEPYSTGTKLKPNPDAGKLYMRSSFDALGTTSWEDTLAPDFSGFRSESSKYDLELAEISAAFAGAVYKVSDIQKTLKNFGFSNIQLCNYNESNDQVVTEEGRDKVAAAFATKRMIFDGEIKTVVAIVIRGTVSEEWYGNFDIKDGERHSGFEKAKTHLMPVLCQYLNDYTSSPADTKILITGHSRGAAVSNLVAADLNNTYAAVFAAQKDIFAYTFATPNSTNKNSDQCNNVFNIINPEDVVTAVPGGFRHVGKDYCISQFEEGEVYDNVQAKFKKLTKSKVKFSVWPDAFYKIAEKLFVTGGYCSDLSWSQAKENLSRMVAICKSMTIGNSLENRELVSAYFIGWLELLDYLDQLGATIPNDSTTAGDHFAALMLNMSGEMPALLEYITDRVWCNHSMEYYYSWITTADVVKTKITLAEDLFHKIVVAIRCPVDVNVYNEAGELVASIVNDQVVIGAGETCNVFGDEKYFVLDGTNYRFEITGYDAGLVDISVTEYSEMFEKRSVSVFEDLPIQKTETMILHYGSAPEEAGEQCYVSTAAGTVVHPETKTAEELEHHQIQVELNGTGFVTGDGVYEVGEMVILSASLAEDFQGWYENGTLLSTEPEYAFACDGTRTVMAVFSDGKMEHVHTYTETVTVPTCTETGFTTYTCSCGESYTGDISASLGHDWETATCQKPKTCTRCGLNEGSATDHVYGQWETILEPTCTAAGQRVRRCVCGIEETEALPMLEHQYVAGTCQLCGAVDMSFLPGDVDGNGIVNYNDALLILRGSINLVKLDERQMMIAEVDGNGVVNYNDALTVLRRSIGLA